MSSLEGILNEELDRTIAAIRAECASGASVSGREDGHGVDMLPLVQRTALRVMFRYLTARSGTASLPLPSRLGLQTRSTLPAAPSSTHSAPLPSPLEHLHAIYQGASGTSGELVPAAEEDAYIASATALRAIIPARARSVFAIVPDWLYRLTPLGRTEAAAVATATALTVRFDGPRRLPCASAAAPRSHVALLSFDNMLQRSWPSLAEG